MTLEAITKEIESATGNLHTAYGGIYITPENMKKFANILASCEDGQEILIAPYLINLEEGGTYELLHYQFLIELLDVPQSYFFEFNPKNILSKEIVDNIKPKAVIPNNDKSILVGILQEYLTKMNEMLFEAERSSNEKLETAKLFYQIF